MNTVLNAMSITGQVGMGAAIVNDYRISSEEIENGHRLTITRGSEVQSFELMNGADGEPGKDAPREAVLYTPQDLSAGQQAQVRRNIGAADTVLINRAVLYMAQNLNASQQAQARTNIGAAAAGEIAPDDKTEAMTQPVGKDADGKLWTAPGGVLYTEQTLTEEQQTQARANISAASAEDTRIIKRTGTLPDHDGLPLTGKTITLRGGIFENANNYVTDARNLIPYPYSFGKASPRLGISFSNIGRLLYVSGTSEKSNENFRFTERVPLPEGVSPGDKLTFRLFSTAVCPSSFSLRVYFYNEAGTQTKNTLTATAYENSKTFTVPADAVSMECILFLPAVDNAIDAALMPVLLRADDAVEQYDPLANGELMTIPAAFDGASHLSSFPCDARVEYEMRVQEYIDEDRSCITPEAFGAEGNGNTDDTVALYKALGYANEKGIALRAARKYKISSPLFIDWDGADVDIHELIYQGADAAIYIEASDVHLRAQRVSSSAAGIVLQSDASTILRCELHLGSVYANGHALDVRPTNYPISINNIHFVTLDAGGVGSCVHYDNSRQVEGAYCTEINYYGGIVQRGQWGFDGILGNAKIINVNIENNVYGGILTYGDIYTFGLRIVEDMRDLPGPLLKISGRPKGTLHAQTAIDLSKIDLSEAIDWYTTEGSSEQKTMYNGESSLKIVNDVSNMLCETSEGTVGYFGSSVLGRQAIVIGKKIIIQRLYETKRVITEAELDLSANAVDLNVTKLIPTVYEAGAAMSIVRLHPSFVSFGHDTVTVIQTDEYKLTLYDCEGHLVFDGAAHGAGTYRLRAYHDYDESAGISYATNFPLIDYSREKWMIVN